MSREQGLPIILFGIGLTLWAIYNRFYEPYYPPYVIAFYLAGFLVCAGIWFWAAPANEAMSEQDETPDCLHIGPRLGPFDDTEASEEIDAEQEYYEYGCEVCEYVRGCRWAEDMRVSWGYSLEDNDFGEEELDK